jgi:predicted PurR-regulated permease PerM
MTTERERPGKIPVPPGDPMSRQTEAARVSQLVFYATVLLIGWLAYRIVLPFLVVIAWAVVLAIVLDPVRMRLLPRLGPTRTAIVLTLGVLVLLVLPIAFVSTTLVREGGPAVTYVQQQLLNDGGAASWFHRGWEWARAHVPFLPTEDEAIADLNASIGKTVQFVIGQAGGILKGAAEFVLTLVITLAVLFFMIRDAPIFDRALRRVLPFGAEQNDRLLKITSDLVSASVTATLTIALLHGVIGGVTFALLGMQGAVLWGTMLAIFSLVPAVGSALIWVPAALWLVFSGSLVKGIILTLVALIILGQIDNVVRPLLLAGKSHMSTLVLIISALGGVHAFGFIGIVLGPLVAALLTALVESYHEVREEPPPPLPEAPAVAAIKDGRETPEGGAPPPAG